MKELSLDPRVNRIDYDPDQIEQHPLESRRDHFPTYEVFHQKKRGAQHVHVGIVHAPNPEMAMVFAKEQYSRRGQTTNIWVVRSSEIYATSYEDEDIFETTPEKQHREPGIYKVRDKIKKYKENQNA